MFRSRSYLLTIVSMLGLAATTETAWAQANQRSAQSDCTREVERRGYTVLSTSNFEQLRDGWRLDIRARDQRGRVADGTCFVETRTGAVRLDGFGGGGSGTADRFEFACASKDNKYRECQLPIEGRARLVTRQSDSPCIEGQTWGQREDRVWVTRGCRASFEVVRGGSDGGSGQSIECRSQNNRFRECAIRDGYEGRLARDYTGRCRKDSTWGNRPGLIWVTDGCQGSFQLVRTGGGGGSGNDNAGQQQRAEVQCRNQAKRQGIKVRSVAPARLQESYWETVVDGTFNGQPIRPTCRFYPDGNRAELLFGSGGSGGGTGGAVTAERACLDEAQRQGYRVVGQSAAQQITGGYGMNLSIRLGNGQVQPAYCRYGLSSGHATLEIRKP